MKSIIKYSIYLKFKQIKIFRKRINRSEVHYLVIWLQLEILITYPSSYNISYPVDTYFYVFYGFRLTACFILLLKYSSAVIFFYFNFIIGERAYGNYGDSVVLDKHDIEKLSDMFFFISRFSRRLLSPNYVDYIFFNYFCRNELFLELEGLFFYLLLIFEDIKLEDMEFVYFIFP